MYLNRLELKNWKNINNLQLDFKKGINLIFGRNEIGKSTIIEALQFAFFKDAGTQVKEVKEVIPWGTSLKGEVKVYFTISSNKNYAVYKSFPKGESQLFLITDENKEVELHNTHKKVQEELYNLLNIKEEKSGLFNLLWINQGESLDLFFKKNPLKNDNEFNTALKDIIKKNVISREAEEFYNFLLKEHNFIFTSSDKVKKNSDILRLQISVHDLKESIEEINNKLNIIEEKNQKTTQLKNLIQIQDVKIKKEEEKLNDLKTKKIKYEKKLKIFEINQEKFNTKKVEFETLEKDYTELNEIIERLCVLEKYIINRGIKRKQLQLQEKKSCMDLNKLKKEEKNYKEDLKKNENLINFYQSLIEKLSIENENNNHNKALNNIKDKIKIYTELKTNLENIEKELKKCKVSNKEIVEKVKKLLTSIEKLKIEINTSTLMVNITSYKKIDLNIKVDDKNPEKYITSKDRKKEIIGENIIKIDVPDLMNINFSGNRNKQELETLREDLGDKTNKLNQVYETIKLNNIKDIENEYQKYEKLNQGKERIKIKSDAILENFNNVREVIKKKEDIVSTIQKNEAQLKEINNKISKFNITVKSKLTKAELELNINTINIKIKKTKSSLISIDKKIENITESLDKKRDEISIINNEITSNETKKGESLNRTKNILNNISIEKFKKNYFLKKDELKYLNNELKKIKPLEKEKINQEIIDKLQGAIDYLNKEKIENEKQTRELNGFIKSLIDENLLPKKSNVEFEYNQKLNELKNEKINIYSLKLLLELLNSEKEKLDKNIIYPLQERLKKAFNNITDNKYSDLSITEDFEIKKVKTSIYNKIETETGIYSLSYGTKEQLSFLFRFIVAQFLSEKEPQVMILDDSFVNTDYSRLQRLLKEINKFSEKIQFLLFTWNQESYLKFKNLFHGNFIDLEKSG